ncbi:MAG: hypothetical protein H0W88_12250 [Parachlamydiaceae bacterium]|nr:hypothetical protein [Parachlamydiaceae bacterium]
MVRISGCFGGIVGGVGAGALAVVVAASTPAIIGIATLGVAVGAATGVDISKKARKKISEYVGLKVRDSINSAENTTDQYKPNLFQWAVGWKPTSKGDIIARQVASGLEKTLDNFDRMVVPDNTLNNITAGAISKGCKISGYEIRPTVENALKENGGVCCPSFVRKKISKWTEESLLPTITQNFVVAPIEDAAQVAAGCAFTATTVGLVGYRIFNAVRG